MRVDKALAVLTRYDSSFGRRFLTSLAERGIRPSLLVVGSTSLTQRCRMLRQLATRLGWVDAVRYNCRFFAPLLKRGISFGRWSPLPSFDGYADRVIKCKDVHDREVIDALANLEISKIILAQSGIIRRPILELPGKWIVNAHPGVLPFFRGVDVIKWSLLSGSPIGATLHIVNAGVDTGDVLKVDYTPVYPDDSIEDVEARTIATSIGMLVEAAIHGPAGFERPQKQDKLAGHQYYLMPTHKVQELRHRWPEIRQNYTNSRPGFATS